MRAGAQTRFFSAPLTGVVMLMAFWVGELATAEVMPLGQMYDALGLNFIGEDCSFLDDVDNDAPTQTCYNRTIFDCAGIDDLTASIRVTDNAGDDGTIFFFSSGGGGGWWASPTDPTDPRHLLMVDLTTGNNDFKLVEIKYGRFWNDGPEGDETGQRRLACGPATHTDWLINHNLIVPGPRVCATGQSGGANQLAYMLTHYGMDDRFDGIVFTSGPLYSDLKMACGTSCDPPPPGDPVPETSEGCFAAPSRWGVDLAYGTTVPPRYDDPANCPKSTPPDPLADEECGEETFDFPCMRHKHESQGTYDNMFVANSIALDATRWDYDYPGDPDALELRFLYGEDDNGPAPEQQRFYFEEVDHNDGVAPRVEVESGHMLPQDADGRVELMNAFVAICGAVQP